MKVLTISNCDLIPEQGSGYVITSYRDRLRTRGHEVLTFGPETCTILPGLTKARGLRLAVGMYLFSLAAIKSHRPDIVEFYGAEAGLATRRLSRIPRRSFKIVAHSNGIEPFHCRTLERAGIYATPDGSRPRWYQGKVRLPQDLAFRYADAIVTVCEPDANFASQEGYQPRDRILAIPNPLPESFIGQSADDVCSRSKVIGYCGSWLAGKGIDLLVRDLSQVLAEYPEWSLHLVGVGQRFDASESFPAELLPRIKVTPFVSDKDELKRVYRGWQIAVLASVYESFGLVAAEAMACGCALVANATGFAATLIHGVEAEIFDGTNSPLLYEAVQRLIQDCGRRRSLARAGWQRVQTLRWADAVEKLERFYLQIIAETTGNKLSQERQSTTPLNG